MTTLTKQHIPIERESIVNENFLLFGFRANPPYGPVLIATRVVSQNNDTVIDDAPNAFSEIMPPGSTKHESLSIEAGLIHQLERLMQHTRLSGRQLEILRLTVNGNSNKQIAYKANISEQTVKNHFTSIIYKLGANNRAHAVALAIRQGLISVQEVQEVQEVQLSQKEEREYDYSNSLG
jgi:DNA-binding CsgD family transcriptional regulator